MKKRNLVIGLLIMLSVIVSGFTFAFWAAGLNGTNSTLESNTINIGTALNAETSLTLGGGATGSKNLVPAGRADNSVGGVDENAESITIEFTVAWNEVVKPGESANYAGSSGSLVVTINNKKIGGSEAHAGLVNIALPSDVTIVEGADAITVSITVTLSEPLTQAIYAAIYNELISFDVKFTVTPTIIVTPSA